MWCFGFRCGLSVHLLTLIFSHRVTIRHVSSLLRKDRCTRRGTTSGGCAGKAILVRLWCWRERSRKVVKSVTTTGHTIPYQCTTVTSRWRCSTTVTIRTGSSRSSWWRGYVKELDKKKSPRCLVTVVLILVGWPATYPPPFPLYYVARFRCAKSSSNPRSLRAGLPGAGWTRPTPNRGALQCRGWPFRYVYYSRQNTSTDTGIGLCRYLRYCLGNAKR